MSDILVRINGHNIVDYFIKHLDSGSHTCTSLFETPNSGYLSCRIHCLCYGIYQNNPFRNDLSHTLSFGHLNTDPIKPVMCLVLLVFFMRKKCKQHILQMTSWRTKHLGLYSWFLPINSRFLIGNLSLFPPDMVMWDNQHPVVADRNRLTSWTKKSVGTFFSYSCLFPLFSFGLIKLLG